ncbi:MAG: PaaI family thioesterase [Spirochaetes bacterium]|nr:PaaI family thioesterase [Spirochaetota bacterium]
MGKNEEALHQRFSVLYQQYRETPFHTLLGMDIQTIEEGRSVLTLPLTHSHMNYRGITHGGVLMSLCDSAMGMAVRSLGHRSVTIEMNISFLDVTREGESLVAEGRILKEGKTLLVCEAEIRQKDRRVAKARGTFYILPEDRGPKLQTQQE